MVKRVKSADLEKLLSSVFQDVFGKEDPNISQKYCIQIDSISAVIIINDKELAEKVKGPTFTSSYTDFECFEIVLHKHGGDNLSPSVVKNGYNIIIQVGYDILD